MVNVVIADDEPDVIESLTTLLEGKGIKVVGNAHDGAEAFEAYTQLKPDVIILDLNMPNYDGHYAIEKIKQEDSKAKIIVISAHLDKTFQSNLVSAVFSKPFEIEDLVKKINEITKSS